MGGYLTICLQLPQPFQVRKFLKMEDDGGLDKLPGKEGAAIKTNETRNREILKDARLGIGWL